MALDDLDKTPHIRLLIDKDGQLYIYDQNTKEKKLISMRANRDGTKTSRDLASEVEWAIWDFRWEHRDTSAEKKTAEKKPAEKKPAEKKPAEKKPAEKKSA